VQPPRIVQSSRSLSLLVLAGLVLGALADVASMFHELSGRTLLDQFFAGEVSQSDLVAWDSTFGSIGLAQTATFLLTAVAWLAWQYRIVASVEPLTHEAPVKTPGRSVLWWFVPFANLVVVPRIYSDLKDKLSYGGSIVVWWWGSYLLSGVVSNFASRMWATVDTPDGFTTGLNLWIAADALTVAAAVIAFRLVQQLQAGQDALIAAPPAPVAVNTLAPPTPPDVSS